MGLHSSGSNIVNVLDTFSDGNDMVEWLNSRLTVNPGSAGWTHFQNLKSQITFFAFAITSGDIAILDGNSYQFYTPPAMGNVLIGADLNETLTNWGDLVQSEKNWNYEIINSGGSLSIHFYDIPYPGNNLFCDITPSGSVGSYDYIVDGVGTGRTWGGGHEVFSANVSGGQALFLKLTTTNVIGGLAITPTDDTFVFDGLNTSAGSWRLLANKYQFFLMVPSAGNTQGTFLFAGHLYPARGISFYNYVVGPFNKTGRFNGSRPGFTGIGQTYYVNNGSPFADSAGGVADKNPTVTVPVYGHGVFTEKGGNPLSGLPIINDLGNAQVFDAFLAAPRLPGENVRNVGWFWDALMYSNQLTMDSGTATINAGKTGYVVLSQSGGDAVQANSPGSLVVQAVP